VGKQPDAKGYAGINRWVNEKSIFAHVSGRCSMARVPRPVRTATLTEQVYASVRAEILAGRLHAGERLRLAALAERHDVSLSVVREALTRLAGGGEHLVSAEPQLGFRVAPVSADELLDLTAVRAEVEGLALRWAIQRGSVDWEAHLLAAHHVLANTPTRQADHPERISEQWATAHARFHAALVEGCGSPMLIQLRRTLYDASERYRVWSVPVGGGDRRDVPREHREIVEAAIAREETRAVALLVKHIHETARILLAGMDAQSAASTPVEAAH
jgi:DNA-binding GntR family transcriptional regulator